MKKILKKKNNKGFSLVELIVVVAIMAILIGVLAPTVMSQIEKSRYSKDLTAIDGINTAFAMVISDEQAGKDLKKLFADKGNTIHLSDIDNDGIENIIKETTSIIKDADSGLAVDTDKLSSDAFSTIDDNDVVIQLVDGDIVITVYSQNKKYDHYSSIGEEVTSTAPVDADGE